MTTTEEESRVSHTSIGKDFLMAASEFLLSNDVWVQNKDYKGLGAKLAKLLEEAYNEGKDAMLRDIIKVAIEERTRK
jgi:hypothetical protein